MLGCNAEIRITDPQVGESEIVRCDSETRGCLMDLLVREGAGLILNITNNACRRHGINIDDGFIIPIPGELFPADEDISI